jgi:hypothetical protein
LIASTMVKRGCASRRPAMKCSTANASSVARWSHSSRWRLSAQSANCGLSAVGVTSSLHSAARRRAHLLADAAPEMATVGSSPCSDIFAMGATVYRLLTGESPFGDRAAAAAGQFTDAHRLDPQIPMSVTRVLRTALSVDPGARFVAMLTALNGCSVAYGWTRADEPADSETWRGSGVMGEYCVRLTSAPNGEHISAMTRDKGSGHRRVHRERFAKLSYAARVRRNLLTGFVEQGR